MEGVVAQLVEQRTENPCVAGSIPARTTSTKDKPLKINRLQRLFAFIILCVRLGVRLL
jgi:hypothetical protein